MKMTIAPSQSRAGRELLEWTQERLAKTAGLGLSTVRNFETMRREVSSEAIDTIRSALENAGIVFLTEGRSEIGVLLRLTSSKESIEKRKLKEKCEMLGLAIIRSFAKIEFLLNDFSVKCQHIQAFKELIKGHTYNFETNIKFMKAAFSLSGPLHKYSIPLQKLLREIVRLRELRNFIVHGVLAISYPVPGICLISYKLYREQKNETEVGELKTNLEHLETSVVLLDRCSKTLSQLFAKVSRDLKLERAEPA
jgi:transcriptional regulator with XRE-family HTH domain